MQLKDKVAIVTGAASGMGKAIAKGYAREGATVIIADLDEEAARTVADEIEASGGKAKPTRYDVTDIEASKQLVDDTVKEFGALDILVNNAGVGLIKAVWEYTPEEWDHVFDVNVRGLFFLTQAACEPMRKQRSGKMINQASIAGRRGEALVTAYCASKACVISITQSVALAMAPYGVNVNAMAPGIVDTPYWREVDLQFGKILGKEPGEVFKEFGGNVPLGRPSVPEDVVPLAIFLAGPGSDYITGQTYNVEGGLVTS